MAEKPLPLEPPPPFQEIPEDAKGSSGAVQPVPEPPAPNAIPPPEAPPPEYGGDALADIQQLADMPADRELPAPSMPELPEAAGAEGAYGEDAPVPGDVDLPALDEFRPDSSYGETDRPPEERVEYGQDPSGGGPDPSFVEVEPVRLSLQLPDVPDQQAEVAYGEQAGEVAIPEFVDLPDRHTTDPQPADVPEGGDKPEFVDIPEGDTKQSEFPDSPFEGEPAPEIQRIVEEMEQRTGADAHEVLGRQLEYAGMEEREVRAGVDLREMEGPVDYQLDVNPALRNFEQPELAGAAAGDDEREFEAASGMASDEVREPLEQMVKLLEDLPDRMAEAMEDLMRIG